VGREGSSLDNLDGQEVSFALSLVGPVVVVRRLRHGAPLDLHLLAFAGVHLHGHGGVQRNLVDGHRGSLQRITNTALPSTPFKVSFIQIACPTL